MEALFTFVQNTNADRPERLGAFLGCCNFSKESQHLKNNPMYDNSDIEKDNMLSKAAITQQFVLRKPQTTKFKAVTGRQDNQRETMAEEACKLIMGYGGIPVP